MGELLNRAYRLFLDLRNRHQFRRCQEYVESWN